METYRALIRRRDHLTQCQSVSIPFRPIGLDAHKHQRLDGRSYWGILQNDQRHGTVERARRHRKVKATPQAYSAPSDTLSFLLVSTGMGRLHLSPSNTSQDKLLS